MDKNKALIEVLKTPEKQRDTDWENLFFDVFLQSKINILNQQPQTGPDGWPYLLVSTDETSQEPVMKLLDWLSTRGIGLVVNPQGDYPDYIFTWGMIWYRKHRGLFRVERTVNSNISSSNNGQINFGPPSEEYIPSFARQIIKEFLLNQGVLNPQWTVASDGNDKHDLCFSLGSLGEPDEKEHKGIAEALSWFLPSHYSVVLVNEDDLKGASFSSLV